MIMMGLTVAASIGLVVAGVSSPAWVAKATASSALTAGSDATSQFAGLRSKIASPVLDEVFNQAAGQAGKTDQELVNDEKNSLANAQPYSSYLFDDSIPAVTTWQELTPSVVASWGFGGYTLKSEFSYWYKHDGTPATPSPYGFENIQAEITVGLKSGSNVRSDSYPFSLFCYKTNWTLIANKIKNVSSSSFSRDAFLSLDNQNDELYAKYIGDNQGIDAFKNKTGVDIDLADELAKAASRISLTWEKKANETKISFWQTNKATGFGDRVAGSELTQTYTSFAKSDQELANDEQTVVNALVPSKTYYFDQSTTAVNNQEVTAADLTVYGIALVPKTDYTYNLTAPSVSASGTLALTITVTKGAAVATGATPINVTAVKTNWTDITTRVAMLTNTSKGEASFKAVAKTNEPLSSLDTELGISTNWGNLIDNRTTLVWSKPANSAVITFDLYAGTTGGTTSNKLNTGTVAVTSFAKSARELVDEEKVAIDALRSSHPFYFDQTSAAITDQVVTSAQLAAYGITYTLKNGLTYKWTVPALSASGSSSFTITISKDGVSAISSPVAFSAVRTNWTNIQAKIAAITSSSLNMAPFKAINKSNQPLSGLATDLGITSDVSSDVGAGTTLLWSKPANSAIVTFDLYGGSTVNANSTKLQTAPVTVNTFAKTEQELVDDEQAVVNALTPSALYYFDQSVAAITDQPVTPTQLAEYNITLVPKPDFTYKWTLPALTASGNLAITIKVSKGTATGTPTAILVTAVKTNWTNIAAKIATMTTSALVEATFKAASKTNQPLSGLPTDLGLANELSALAGTGVTLVWSKAANSDVVTFDLYAGTNTASGSTKLQSASVTVANFAQSEQQVVDNEQAIVNALRPSGTYYFDRSVSAVSDQSTSAVQLANYFITLVPKAGFTYKLTVPPLSASGELAIMITVSKGALVGTPTQIKVNAVRTNWTQLSALISNLTSSTLDEAAFKTVVNTNQPISTLNTSLGISANLAASVSGGTSLWWTKASNSAIVTFDLYDGSTAGASQKKLKTATVTVASFAVSEDHQAVSNLAILLRQVKTTSKTEPEFNAITVADGTALDETLATRLGVTFPTVESGITVTVKKSDGEANVTYTVTKGAETQTLTVALNEFAESTPATDSVGSSPNLGAIIGGTVGGVAGAAAIAGLTTYLIKRGKRRAK